MEILTDLNLMAGRFDDPRLLPITLLPHDVYMGHMKCIIPNDRFRCIFNGVREREKESKREREKRRKLKVHC